VLRVVRAVLPPRRLGYRGPDADRPGVREGDAGETCAAYGPRLVTAEGSAHGPGE